MDIHSTALPDVKLLTPKVYTDDRGFFLESYNRRAVAEVLKVDLDFVQDNHSRSRQNVIRGLHYQLQRPQGKMVRVITGEIYDVVVDLRKGSSGFGQWVAVRLCSSEQRLLWVPEGFAHGFLVLSEYADVMYKTTDYYDPASERTLRWDDPQLSIPWPLQGTPVLSIKDRQGQFLKSADIFP